MTIKTALDSRTTIPLYAVVSTVPFLLGAILWLTNVDAKASTSLAETKDVKETLSQVQKILWQVQRSQIRMEAKLGTSPRRQPDDSE